MKFFFAFILVFGLNFGLCVAENAEENERAVPSASALKEAEDLLNELLESDRKAYRAKKLSGTEYGAKLTAYLSEAEEDAVRYTLMQEAKSVYLQSGELESAFEILTLLQETFPALNLNAEKAAAISQAFKSAKPAQYEARMELFNAVYQAEFEAENTVLCAELEKLAAQNISKCRKTQAYAEYQTMHNTAKAARESAEKLKQAKRALAASPDDPKLNQDYALLLLKTGDDWDLALPHFSKGSDVKMGRNARLEIGNVFTDKEALEIAEFWYDLGDAQADKALKNSFKAHSLAFFEQGKNELSGIRLKVVEKKIAEVKKLSSGTVHPAMKSDKTLLNIAQSCAKNEIIGPGQIIQRCSCNAPPHYRGFIGRGVLTDSGDVFLISSTFDRERKQPGVWIAKYSPTQNKLERQFHLPLANSSKWQICAFLHSKQKLWITDRTFYVNGAMHMQSFLYDIKNKKVEETIDDAGFFPVGTDCVFGTIDKQVGRKYEHLLHVYSLSKKNVVKKFAINELGGMFTPIGNDRFVFIANGEIVTYDARENTVKFCKFPLISQDCVRALLGNGDVFFCRGGHCAIFSPIENKIKSTVDITNQIEERILRYKSALLLPSGDVLLSAAGYNSNDLLLIFNPEKNQIIHRFPIPRDFGSIGGGTLLPNGDVVLLSTSIGGDIAVYRPDYKNKKAIFKKETCLSPYINHL